MDKALVNEQLAKIRNLHVEADVILNHLTASGHALTPALEQAAFQLERAIKDFEDTVRWTIGQGDK